MSWQCQIREVRLQAAEDPVRMVLIPFCGLCCMCLLLLSTGMREFGHLSSPALSFSSTCAPGLLCAAFPRASLSDTTWGALLVRHSKPCRM